MDWHYETRICACGKTFAPKREAQAYCSKRCANAATQRRKRSGDTAVTPRSYREVVTCQPRANLGACRVALRWFGQSETFTTARHQVRCRVTITL